MRITEDHGFHCLEVPHAEVADGGVYRCTAKNYHGEVVCETSVYVGADVPKTTATEQEVQPIEQPKDNMESIPSIDKSSEELIFAAGTDARICAAVKGWCMHT